MIQSSRTCEEADAVQVTASDAGNSGLGTHFGSTKLADLPSRPFSLGAAGRVDLRFDILNVFNDTAEESIANDRYNAPTYNAPNVFLDPRRVMLSVKVNLGK